MPQGNIWRSLPLPDSSIWIFTLQKFRWEVLAVKYAPRKVYIKENGGYVELSYKDFCRRREANQSYMDKLKAALPLLSDSEQVLIKAIFFEELSEREVGLKVFMKWIRN